MLFTLIDVYSLIVFIAVVLSWVRPPEDNGFVRIIHQLTEPVLSRVRSILPAAAGFDFSPMVVLIALQLLKSLLLRLAGHTVRYASHPGAALAVAPELNPDVCILDIGLPGMNGLDLARHLRSLPQTQAALFIALSGYGKPEDKAEAEAAGFAWHLTKPIDPEQLQALLTQAREDGE